MKNKVEGNWDLFVEYEEAKKKFKHEIKDLRKDIDYHKTKGNKRPAIRRKLAYNGILLTQLVNGSRISEAVDGIMKFLNDEKASHEQYVEARKRKANKKKRIMGIPTDVKQEDFTILKEMKPKQIQFNVWVYARKQYNINTHSLRYAWISQRNKEKYPANVTAKITGHSNVGMIEHYTREQEANKEHLEWVKKQ